ncbi:MAG: IS21 family transposase [Chloroflexota bacterium]|nr:IS21 family transposase [Chloroflexota bacterium]
MQTIRELAAQGHSIRAIAAETGMARNTVRKYLRGTPEAAPRPRRESKLDPFKAQIRQWITEDRLLNCETMLERLQAQGYRGSMSILKDFVQPLRPPRPGRQPVRRYETKPGEQMQIDWGEFLFEQDGQLHKLYGFTAVLSYSRMRFVCFTKRCDTPSLIRCLMQACEYFDGLPLAILTDRMKSVLLQMDGRTPVWNGQFADFLAAIGVTARVCRAYTPQTKGKIERSIGVVKQSFWPGVRFTEVTDLNRQAQQWCDRRNQRVHATTRVCPLDRWVEEGLKPLPTGFAWERFRLEERRVTADGFISFDGVLYGLPAAALLTGRVVQVGLQRGTVTIWHQGQLIAEHAVRGSSGTQVIHPEQFAGVPPARMQPPAPAPLGHQVPRPVLVRRSLDEYDQLYGVAVVEVVA